MGIRQRGWTVIRLGQLKPIIAILTILFMVYLSFWMSPSVSGPEQRPLDIKQAIGTDAEDSGSSLQQRLQHKFLDHRNNPLPNITREWYENQGQPEAILKLLKGKKNGTFIEAGGNNGIHHSNTLPLEMEHGWRGLLIEPVPYLYWQMVSTGRSAMFLEGCLSPKTTAYLATIKAPVPSWTVLSSFRSTYERGKVWHGHSHLSDDSVVPRTIQIGAGKRKAPVQKFQVECYPLYDIMEAANLTTVDALMLDVQGPELAILRTLPWDHVNIQVIQMENLYRHTKQKEKAAEFLLEARKLLEPHGYKYQMTLKLDHFFVKLPID